MNLLGLCSGNFPSTQAPTTKKPGLDDTVVLQREGPITQIGASIGSTQDDEALLGLCSGTFATQTQTQD